MKSSLKSWLALAGCAFALLAPTLSRASVVITGTRVVYNARDVEAVVKLGNEGALPALVQSWIDSGNPRAAPSAIDVPFTVTPPIARIDPGKGQTLRILYTGQPLPQDRESVFWLNVMEIPPKPSGDAAATNRLQLAFRSRIKLFFRPEGLKGGAGDAPGQITWRLLREGEGWALEARNPTPYHVSFAALELLGGGHTASFQDGGMVGPGEAKRFPLAGEVFAGAENRVVYHAISDYGGPIDGEATLSAAPVH